ncbi:hypothetical protein M378DRAFT_164975 [Amanita muscaria Koide BX008]|uniref:Uncharacterized protein n=1 Tax=Amanita muscaria (strain Koide BX008) TaxID=946122 RepID=A0A0C2X2Z5_AMAMK|nr:hypothetical protein M378DRAFT_164975 [Amanita muscaria Koide BX008]
MNRGRNISNGSLYLVTSFTKCIHWGIAVFNRPCNPGQGLTFVNTPFGWKGSRGFTTKVSDTDKRDIPNQCVFLRGYKIMVRQDIFDNLGNDQPRGSGSAMPFSSSQAGSISMTRQPATRLRGGGGTDFMSKILTGKNLFDRTTTPTVTTDKVVLHPNFSSSPVHPSDVINAALLSQVDRNFDQF